MAQTLYLNDGTSVVMFSSPCNNTARQDEFARVLLEHLGADAEKEFLRIVGQINKELDLAQGRILP